MKRSEVNNILQEACEFLNAMKFLLPPWAYFRPARWKKIMDDPEESKAYAEIIDNRLGWDLTDFGSRDYSSIGLLLFTLRNGNPGDPEGKPYAEKILISKENQVTHAEGRSELWVFAHFEKSG